MAHNRAVLMLVESLHGPLLMSLEKARDVAPMHGRRGVDEHRARGRDCRRDEATASHLMARHLSRTAARLAGPGAEAPIPGRVAGGARALGST